MPICTRMRGLKSLPMSDSISFDKYLCIITNHESSQPNDTIFYLKYCIKYFKYNE